MKKALVSFFFVTVLFNSLYSQSTIDGKINNTLPICDCWQSRDSSFHVAQFDGSGGSGGPGIPPEYRNDDWSTGIMNLPFVFCFYGDSVTSLYINNNGNVSMRYPLSLFGSGSLRDTTPMIAPFWADVDTRGFMSGLVYYSMTPTHLIIQWDHVGYFMHHDTSSNTFQLIISDGNDPIIPDGKNMSFCYREMQWTTGDASNGHFGFPLPPTGNPPYSIPGKVGVSRGDSINYIQLGYYGDSTNAYDGPWGLDDGVYSLNNKSFSFDLCFDGGTSIANPPLYYGENICDTIDLCSGESFSFIGSFISPDSGQISSVSMDAHGMGGINFMPGAGIVTNFYITFIAGSPGFLSIDILANDSLASLTTTYPLNFNIQNCNVGISENITGDKLLFPTTIHDNLNLKFSTELRSIKIRDLLGKLIFESPPTSSLEINTSDWPKGIYIVNIDIEEKVVTKKILIY